MQAAEEYFAQEFIGNNLCEEVKKAYAQGMEKAVKAAVEVFNGIADEKVADYFKYSLEKVLSND